VKLSLSVDGLPAQIDTRDPELLARWLLEQFALINWTPATLVEAWAYPTWDYSRDPRPDWLTDSVQLSERWRVKSPEDVVAALSAALGRAREQ